MLTHEQKTQIKIAMSARKRPEDIAAEMGLTLDEVDACLQSARPRAAIIRAARGMVPFWRSERSRG